MLRLMLLLSIFIIATQANAHSVKWINGTEYDYIQLTRGKNCCDDLGRECRPAFSYSKGGGGWFLVIPVDGHDPSGPRIRIFVAEASVTYRDLGRDGVAHYCGKLIGGAWSSYCTFIPPGFVSIEPLLGRHQGALLTERPSTFRRITKQSAPLGAPCVFCCKSYSAFASATSSAGASS